MNKENSIRYFRINKSYSKILIEGRNINKSFDDKVI